MNTTQVINKWFAPNINEYFALFFKEINEMPKCENPITLFGTHGVVRKDDNGRFWVMDREEEGWASYGVPYNSLRQIVNSYNLKFISIEKDSHGELFRFEICK